MKLPNLVIAGVPKAGTTSLFDMLAGHPDIFGSRVKELNYFTSLRAEGGALEDLASYARYFQHCGAESYRMEASPTYCMGGERLVSAMKEVLPGVRVMISLRDPAACLWSTFQFLQSLGRLDASLDYASFVARCEEGKSPGPGFDMPAGRTPLDIGRYAEWLPMWLDAFGPDLRVVFFEDLLARREVLSDLASWLGINPSWHAELGHRNATVVARNPRLARWAYRTKRISEQLFPDQRAARRVFAKAYRWINTAPRTESAPASTQRHVAELYSEPNRELGRLLVGRGYRNLPGWLNLQPADKATEVEDKL